ncbi:Xaa-Pro aminopeptidase [Candidatus Thiosymbion oneisti]|uniref:Xaa-Pro aminopeptidase n=1 Tax=Candidatus Thiosymbion oneisti TaxID=589554 RepID=UPI000ADEB2FD|nr:Xaa-Pro aminopeptidase [Candidatus Thiosymbion oneisti]
MTAAEYKRRRRRLAAAMKPGSIALLAAAPESVRNRDVHYPYRQDSDFFYVTGFPEPEALAVLVPGRKEGELVFFCRPRDSERELWEGARSGVEGVRQDFGAAEAHPIDKLDEVLPKLLEDRDRVYYPAGANPALDQRLMEWVNVVRGKVRSGVHAPTEFVALERLLSEQRLRKSKAELKIIRRAVRISAAAHRRVMRLCRSGMREYELEAEFVQTCAARGGRFQAYPPIVGSGANACVLHYVDNRHRLADGELVLIDAGCELAGYAADITRTFPVNGRFSPPQRELYELVLAAQEAAIAKAVPGNRWNAMHKAAVRTLTEGLVELGILKGGRKAVPKLIKKEKYKPYFMHRTGHWLGMDVHDAGDYRVGGKWRRLEPGMVLTVEPGLYIPADRTKAPAHYRGIGIRIEDDVLITAEGNEVLSMRAPKTVADIESCMSDE